MHIFDVYADVIRILLHEYKRQVLKGRSHENQAEWIRELIQAVCDDKHQDMANTAEAIMNDILDYADFIK